MRAEIEIERLERELKRRDLSPAERIKTLDELVWNLSNSREQLRSILTTSEKRIDGCCIEWNQISHENGRQRKRIQELESELSGIHKEYEIKIQTTREILGKEVTELKARLYEFMAIQPPPPTVSGRLEIEKMKAV